MLMKKTVKKYNNIIEIILNCKDMNCEHRSQFPHNCMKCYQLKKDKFKNDKILL